MADRPLGAEIADWVPPPRPTGLHLRGHWADLRPLSGEIDTPALWQAFEGHDWVWGYLGEAAPQDLQGFATIMDANAARVDQPCYAIRAATGGPALGYACYWTVVPAMGSNEIGNVNLSPELQQTPVATDAFFLMADWAFSNGYRRLEWKCNALNAPSRRAAQRLGFSFEGVFRNHLIVKGRNRNTAWFAITDQDWVGLRDAYQMWLSPANFDSDGRQRQSLSALTAPHLVMRDPTQA